MVHSSQLSWLRGVAQARLAAAGLSGALASLRFFCRSLSLELLYTQTLRLCRDRLARHLQVDRYTPGQKLQISYWRYVALMLYLRVIYKIELRTRTLRNYLYPLNILGYSQFNIPKDLNLKIYKYYNFMEDMTQNSYKIYLFAVKGRTRKISATSVFIFNYLGLIRLAVSSFMDHVFKIRPVRFRVL